MNCIYKFTFTAFIYCLALFTWLIASSQAQPSDLQEKHPQVIGFNPEISDYQEILDGPNDGTVFYSGFVTILPGQTGELHSTEDYEEMIVILNGHGQVLISGSESLEIRYGCIAYIPPETEHRVYNTGTENLKYIYIATKSR